jgi:hypothetical protein
MNRLSGKTRHGNVNIRREEDDIRRGNFAIGQRLFRSERALSFDLDFVPHGGRSSFQRLGGHESVSDSSWTGSNSDKSFHIDKTSEVFRKITKD